MSTETISILFAGISTIAIFSFLIKENPFYRSFEYIFIGIAAGYIPLVTLKTFLWPEVIDPIFNSQAIVLPDGALSVPRDTLVLLYIIPILFGGLYYTIYVPHLRWIARSVIAFSLGASAGLSFQGFFSEVIPQIQSSFKPLNSVENILFITILISTMYYFFFTIKRGSKIGYYTSLYARCWMMICFGAFFGSTIMARLALLVERLQFTIDSWIPALIKVFFA